MEEKIKKLIKHALKNLSIESENIILEHPADNINGDYSTNVAMACAKQAKINPKDLAEKIVGEINKNKPKEIEKVEVAGFGFINFYLSREFFVDSVKEILEQKENWGKNKVLAGKKIMVEYTDPNPFKPFHIGHLMSNAIGESVSRIVEFSGAKTIRANYQGDVGPHVAKAIYELLKTPIEELIKINPDENVSFKAQFIGECYVKGNHAYENDEQAKAEINEINKKVYDRSDKKINQVYDWGRRVTLEAFEEIYALLGTNFNRYFFESQMADIGKNKVLSHMNVFEKSEGAIIFPAEKYDPKLHTRVFINSQGLPTYEAKELGLALTKFKKGLFEKKLDLSIILTGKEQYDYMKVIQKVISIIHPDYAKRMKHIPHGLMTLSTGKMSSRAGNVITGELLLKESMMVIREKISDREFSQDEKNKISESVGVGAIKYSILKSSIESDIIYDFDKSISFEGDSGPYLQYTAVRANSILEKAKEFNLENGKEIPSEITNLEKLLYQFPEVVERSYTDLAPHFISTYLTELASAFNTFYGNTKIIDKENKNISYHLDLVKSFYQTMKNGLWLLGIETPDRM